jgi:hypothetical protein
MTKEIAESVEAEPKNDPRIRAFQKLWLAGAAGAFFSALTRSIATDIPSRAWPSECDVGYTVVQFARYIYLIWFLFYFFAVRFQVEDLAKPQRLRDAIFDIIQSILALISIVLLGFVIQVDKFDLQWGPYLFVNLSILGICILALRLFWNDRDPDRFWIRIVRFAGIVISGFGVGVSYCHWHHDDKLHPLQICWFSLPPALLVVLLVVYFVVRVLKTTKNLPDPSDARFATSLKSLREQFNAYLKVLNSKHEKLESNLIEYQKVLESATTELEKLKPPAVVPASPVTPGVSAPKT